jgi:hypothetical protein
MALPIYKGPEPPGRHICDPSPDRCLLLGLPQDHHQLNLGTWEYKIPSAYDIPIELNVSLLPDTPNPATAGCLQSKASAEPSMPTALSALFAVKQAIYAARQEAGDASYFELSIPVTVEQIQQCCLVQPAQLVLGAACEEGAEVDEDGWVLA